MELQQQNKIDYTWGRWIPNPKVQDPLNPDNYVDGKVGGTMKPLPEILVKSPEEHYRVHPQDYEAALAEKPATQRTVEESVTAERQRCASIARSFRNGEIIATAILADVNAPITLPKPKAVPPTLKDCIKKGYTIEAAGKIVAQEQIKCANGYPPYGDNMPPDYDQDNDPLGIGGFSDNGVLDVNGPMRVAKPQDVLKRTTQVTPQAVDAQGMDESETSTVPTYAADGAPAQAGPVGLGASPTKPVSPEMEAALQGGKPSTKQPAK